MNEMDMEFPKGYMYNMQGAAATPTRGQVSPNAAGAALQRNPALMNAVMQSDLVEDLLDNKLVQQYMMAKQLQGGQQPATSSSSSPGRGRPQGFGDYAQYASFF